MIKRVSTGIEKLDAALQGGIPQGSWVAVSGEPGVGKSILAMHFAWAGLKVGEPVVYVTTEQEFKDVVEQARQFGMDFSERRIYSLGWRKEPEEPPEIVVIDVFGLLKVARRLSEEAQKEDKARRYAALSIDTLVEAVEEAYKILNVIEERGTSPVTHVRLVVDSMSAFWVDRPAMARKYSYQLKIALHRDNVTGLFTLQYAITVGGSYGFGMEHVADGVIHMWFDDIEKSKEVRRWLIIKKMRMTDHAKKAFRVEIENGRGLVLLD